VGTHSVAAAASNKTRVRDDVGDTSVAMGAVKLGASLPQIGRMMPDPLVETTVTSNDTRWMWLLITVNASRRHRLGFECCQNVGGAGWARVRESGPRWFSRRIVLVEFYLQVVDQQQRVFLGPFEFLKSRAPKLFLNDLVLLEAMDIDLIPIPLEEHVSVVIERVIAEPDVDTFINVDVTGLLPTVGSGFQAESEKVTHGLAKDSSPSLVFTNTLTDVDIGETLSLAARKRGKPSECGSQLPRIVRRAGAL
jgi:hypothetical protein